MTRMRGLEELAAQFRAMARQTKNPWQHELMLRTACELDDACRRRKQTVDLHIPNPKQEA
jgi:hypothetical protein